LWQPANRRGLQRGSFPRVEINILELPLSLISIVAAFAGVVVLVAALTALVRRWPFAFVFRTVVAMLFLAVAAVGGMLGIGTLGYLALTKEEVAARIKVEPAGPGRFTTRFRFPDGRTATYVLAGDEVYVDARILKWKPIANLLGLHTQYELDRVAGRFRDLEDERTRPRTVFALGQTKPVDVFTLRQRYALLEPVVDAEYGSASFVPADHNAEWDLLVSASGLMFRPSAETPRSRQH